MFGGVLWCCLSGASEVDQPLRVANDPSFQMANTVTFKTLYRLRGKVKLSLARATLTHIPTTPLD